MPRYKVDLTASIRDSKKRIMTFCKRKKELLKRAIELSNMCSLNIMLVIQNPENSRMTVY